MERERLARLLEEPGRIAREDLVGLKALAEKYPWFSGAQLLRTAGERMGGDVLFDETLRTTSAHLPSRAVLFDLTTAPEARPVTLHVVKPDPVGTAPEPRPLKNPLVAEVLPPRPPVQEPAAPVVVSEPVEEVSLPPMPAPAPIPATVEVQPAVAAKDDLGDELELQILRNAIANAYDLTLTEQVPTAAPAQEQPVHQAPEPPVPARINPSPDSLLRFTDWLDVESVPAAAEHQPKESPVMPAVEPKAEQLDAAVLIDRFIEHEAPPPPPQRVAFFTPQEAGKRSLDDTAGLVTETLARIYVKQGNLQKAIAAYERLALKHPEKGAYFAALQKELREQSNK